MKTKLFLSILFFLVTQNKILSQNNDIEISIDKFLRLNYDVNQIIPNHKSFKIIDYISNLIKEQKIPTGYHLCWQVEYLKCEKENDTLIEYKRLDYLLNYIEKKHHIDRVIFKYEFSETQFCVSSSINFMIIK